jgi:hypothetical protein
VRIRLRLFGRTVASLLFDPGDVLELLEEGCEADQGIGGGSGHNFERSQTWEYPDDADCGKGFGFNR